MPRLNSISPAKTAFEIAGLLCLTDAGGQYYPKCADLIEAFEETESAVPSREGKLRGTLRLTAPTTFGELFLQLLLHEFCAPHPDLTIDP